VTNPQNPTPDQNPDPETTPGVQASPPPGDIPPDAGQMSGAAGDVPRHAPNQGPVSGNRTPMIITLAVLAFMVVAIAVITGASFIPS
jgi:hypothetical protein